MNTECDTNATGDAYNAATRKYRTIPPAHSATDHISRERDGQMPCRRFVRRSLPLAEHNRQHTFGQMGISTMPRNRLAARADGECDHLPFERAGAQINYDSKS